MFDVHSLICFVNHRRGFASAPPTGVLLKVPWYDPVESVVCLERLLKIDRFPDERKDTSPASDNLLDVLPMLLKIDSEFEGTLAVDFESSRSNRGVIKENFCTTDWLSSNEPQFQNAVAER
jgi:hypothetical protein